MKSLLQKILQSILGFQTYLFIFSLYKIKTLNWDKGEKDFFYFLNLIPRQGHILDLGANIGIMTYHLSKRASLGKVIAFEPIKWNAATLHKIIDFYKLNNVRIEEVALGNSNTPLQMVLPVVNGVKKQGLSHVLNSDITEFNEGIKVEVNQITLDSYQSKIGAKVAAIKIDVENFEYLVFKGATNLIQNDKPIIYCELWDNQNRSNCFEFLTENNYSIMVVDQNKLVKFESKLHKTQNFIFIPNTKDL